MDFMKRGGGGVGCGVGGVGCAFSSLQHCEGSPAANPSLLDGKCKFSSICVWGGVCMPTCMGARVCYSGIRNLFQAPQQRVAHGSYCPRSARVKSREVTDVLTIFSSQNRINLV